MEKSTDKIIASRAFFNQGDDKILYINSVATTRKLQGEKILNASIGALFDEDGTLANLNIVDQELKANLTDKSKSYPTTTGGAFFQDGILKWLFLDKYEQYKKKLDPKVIATCGGTGAISLALRNYLENEQTVLLPSIGWSNYEALVNQSQAKYQYYNLFKDNSFDLEDFKRVALDVCNTEKRLFAIVNDPCENPTGYVMTNKELDELIQFLNNLATKYPVVLLMDIAYFDFEEEIRSRIIFDKLSNLNPNFLCLCAFSASKTFSIYGLRLGALISFANDKTVSENFMNVSTSTARALWSCANGHAINTVAGILNDDTKRKALLLELKNKREMLAQRGNIFANEMMRQSIKTFPYISGFFITIPVNNANEIFSSLADQGIFVYPMKNKYIRVALSSLTLDEVKKLAKELSLNIKKFESS